MSKKALKSPSTEVLTERLLNTRKTALGLKTVKGTKKRVFSPRIAVKSSLALAKLHGLIEPEKPGELVLSWDRRIDEMSNETVDRLSKILHGKSAV